MDSAFEDGDHISSLYGGNGTKLRATHVIGNATTVTDYYGNVVYESGISKTFLTEAGYVTLPDRKYHYFIQDHQGNNRLVVDQSGGIEEVNDYYPFGGLMSSSSVSAQNYKYNGKELDRKSGLDWYDYGARHYDATIGRWHVVDPHAEKYYSVNPYVYCLNNPVRYIDSDGRDPGDFFKTKDAAAKDWGDYYNGASISRGNEFGSTIYKIKVNGKTGYTYSVANEGGADNVTRSNAPNEEAPEAIIYSHGEYIDGYNNNFSNKDKWSSYNLAVDSYVATPDGSLKKYDPNTAKTNVVTTDLPSDPKDPDRKNKKTPVDIPKEKEYQKQNTPEKKKEENKNSYNNR